MSLLGMQTEAEIIRERAMLSKTEELSFLRGLQQPTPDENRCARIVRVSTRGEGPTSIDDATPAEWDAASAAAIAKVRAASGAGDIDWDRPVLLGTAGEVTTMLASSSDSVARNVSHKLEATIRGEPIAHGGRIEWTAPGREPNPFTQEGLEKLRELVKPAGMDDLRKRRDALQAELERARLEAEIHALEAELRRLRSRAGLKAG